MLINDEVDKESLAYRLWSVYGFGDSYDIKLGKVTICSYIRRVIGGAALALFGIFAATIILLPYLNLIAMSIIRYQTGTWQEFMLLPPDGPSFSYFWASAMALSGMAQVVVAVIGAILFASSKYEEHRVNRVYYKEAKKPGLIVSYYRAWKEKYCPIVHFKE